MLRRRGGLRGRLVRIVVAGALERRGRPSHGSVAAAGELLLPHGLLQPPPLGTIDARRFHRGRGAGPVAPAAPQRGEVQRRPASFVGGRAGRVGQQPLQRRQRLLRAGMSPQGELGQAERGPGVIGRVSLRGQVRLARGLVAAEAPQGVAPQRERRGEVGLRGEGLVQGLERTRWIPRQERQPPLDGGAPHRAAGPGGVGGGGAGLAARQGKRRVGQVGGRRHHGGAIGSDQQRLGLRASLLVAVVGLEHGQREAASRARLDRVDLHQREQQAGRVAVPGMRVGVHELSRLGETLAQDLLPVAGAVDEARTSADRRHRHHGQHRAPRAAPAGRPVVVGLHLGNPGGGGVGPLRDGVVAERVVDHRLQAGLLRRGRGRQLLEPGRQGLVRNVGGAAWPWRRRLGHGTSRIARPAGCQKRHPRPPPPEGKGRSQAWLHEVSRERSAPCRGASRSSPRARPRAPRRRARRSPRGSA